MKTTKGYHVHGLPILSPVLEDFVPPQFRGNVADSPTTTSAVAIENAPVISTATEAPPNWYKESFRKGPANSESKASAATAEDNGNRSGVSPMLHNPRSRAERGPVQVPVQRPVQVQGLPRQKVKRRSIGHYFNPFSLFAKLRDAYIQLMNGVATSGVIPSGPVGDSSAQHSTLFFSREYDTESIAQLKELERNSSKDDAQYRQNLASGRNSSRVKPFGDPGLKLGGDPVLERCKSTKTHADLAFYSTSRSGRRLSGESAYPRSKSNPFSDEVFYSRKLKGSRKKKLQENPYADSDWKAATVARESKAESKLVGSNDLFREREKLLAGTASRTEFRLQQSASPGSLFAHKE